MRIERITRPVLLLNEERCRSNIRKMVWKASSSGVILRPHVKTHHSSYIADWFSEYGVSQITVSSVTMCNYFMDNGWKDITIAFPVNPREIKEINRIADQIKLNILVGDYEHLSSVSDKIDSPVGVFFKIDTGYRRSGIDWNRYTEIQRMADLVDLRGALRMEGLLTHSGHTYGARGEEEVLAIYTETREKMQKTKEILQDSDLLISIGDTPSCVIAPDLSGIDEIRPGNFVFFDYMQSVIGSCKEEEIAVAMAAPVVSVNRHRNEAIIYAGAVHLSKDRVSTTEGVESFGKVVSLNDEGWDSDKEIGYIASLSQEHGVVKLCSEAVKSLHPGDLVAVLPVHSCLTADLMRSYLTLNGETITASREK
jgi:D-serine deaminase-like pyridoxal phosphate-dependent protein